MFKRILLFLLCVCMLTATIQPFSVFEGEEVSAADTIYVFDLEAYINTLPSSGPVRYDYLKFATALQGLANRDKPQLYFMFKNYWQDQDAYWLKKLSADGEYLSQFKQVTLTDFWQVVDMFRSCTNGLVLWDSAVPATSNVASTVAGADNLLPVRFDTSTDSLYNTLLIKGYTASDVKVDLVGKFTGKGTIPNSSTASTGSAKNDAYIWAKEQYLDKGKTSATKMTYSVDAWVKDATTTQSAAPTRNASVISVKLPQVMKVGSTAEVEVTVQNLGAEAWTYGTNHRLGNKDGVFSWKDSVVPTYADKNRAFLNVDTATLGTHTFKFTITAPSKAGTYPFSVQMVRDGVAWFGNVYTKDIAVVDPDSTTVDLSVSGVITAGTTTAEYNAEIVSVSMPSVMNPGEVYNASITVKNLGTNTWTAAEVYRLGKKSGEFGWKDLNNSYNSEGGRLYLSSSVAQNGTYTFNVAITAPSQVGNYLHKFQMVRDGVRWFGPLFSGTVAVVDENSYTPVLETVSVLKTDTRISTTTATYPDLMNTMLPNADYFIAEKAFFFDLAPGGNPPIDDRSQATGTDVATLRKLLSSQQTKANGKVFTVSGFVPWWSKYTTHCDSSSGMEPVYSEWTMVDIISEYLGQVDADAYGYTGLSNASVFSKVPLNENLTQNNDKGDKDNKAYRSDTDYIVFYMGDFDAASWTSSLLPSLWDDSERGTLPLAWPVCADLSQRVPHVFNYLYETATANDYFVSGDNGTGYLNPMKLSSSELNIWKQHNIASNKKFDIDITGFLIAGNSATVSQTVQNAYNEISPYGVIYQGNTPAGGKVYNGTPYTMYYDIGNSIPSSSASSVAATIYNRMVNAGQFHVFRSILTKPSVINDIVDALKANYPNQKFEVVSPYTFMGMYEASKAGTVTPTTYDADIMGRNIPTTVEAGSTVDIYVDVQNLGSATWTEANQYRLGSTADNASSFKFSGSNPNRISISNGASVYTGEVHQFKTKMTAPTQTGTYSMELKMVRDGVTWFGDSIKLTINVVEPAPEPEPEPEPEPPKEPFELVDGAEYTLSSNILKGVEAGANVNDIISRFKCEVKVTDADGNAADGTACVGTGYKVTEVDGTGVATVIVRGDSSGDGVVSTTDYIIMERSFLGSSSLSEIQSIAADMDSNGAVSSSDLLVVEKMISN